MRTGTRVSQGCGFLKQALQLRIVDRRCGNLAGASAAAAAPAHRLHHSMIPAASTIAVGSLLPPDGHAWFTSTSGTSILLPHSCGVITDLLWQGEGPGKNLGREQIG